MTRSIMAVAFWAIASPLVAADDVVAQFAALDLTGGRIECANPGEWKFTTRIIDERDHCATLEVEMTAPKEMVPPTFTVRWNVPQGCIRHFWSPQTAATELLMAWHGYRTSDIAHAQPLYALTGDADEAEFAVASSECLRPVRFMPTCDDHGQSKMYYKCWMSFFTAPEAPLSHYRMRMRFDRRQQPYWQTLKDLSAWQMAAAGLTALPAGDQCFKPLYSSWYTYHGQPTQADIEGDCKIAAAMGMSNLILDDGWNCDPGKHGYRYCGDWEISTNKFPDMKAHVDSIHAMGMKYMMWFAVPFVGQDAKVYSQWKDKLLPISCAGGEVLDPRFPEVREFIASLYERKLKEFGIDGFKLDFIDCFRTPEPDQDPAIKDNYRGRDIKSVPEAVKVLMTEVMTRLRRIKPDIMIEFRQAYTGPAIRSFGNMLRATDCPMDPDSNRERIARLRLVSGDTAIHADMLAWRFDASPEVAAENILHAIFGVVQYSVELKKAPAEQLRMVRHWVQFSRQHERALLRGDFRARLHYARYPLLEGECEQEKIIGVYDQNLVASVGALEKPVYVLNGTGGKSLVIDAAAPARAMVFDTFGTKISTIKFEAGIHRVAVPRSGYVELRADGKPKAMVSKTVKKNTVTAAKIGHLELELDALAEAAPLFLEALEVNEHALERERQHNEMLRQRGVAEVEPSRAAVRYSIDTAGMSSILFDEWGELYVDRRFITDDEMKVIHRIEAFFAKWFPVEAKAIRQVPRRLRASPVGLPVFRGFEDDRYQQHDALIAKLVAEFNANKAAWCGGTSEQAKKIQDVQPALIKSHMIEESGGNGSRSLAAWAIDPLQVNVPGDWGDEKRLIGLTKPEKRNEGSVETNIRAAIMYLSRKGFSPSGRPAAERKTGFFDGWLKALQRYNGRRDRTDTDRYYSDEYADKIVKRAQNPDIFVPIEIKLAKAMENANP